jgi:hypothetical protein
MIRQFAVALLMLFPFSLSITAAYLAWAAFPKIEFWHIVVTTLVWVAAFAAGTKIFWKVTDLLVIKR